MKKKRPPKRIDPAAKHDQTTAHADAPDHFPIVAAGASAGGFEAFVELIKSLSPETGMAFVLIQHLDPKHHSLLASFLAKETSMRVIEVTDGLVVKPDHIYVIPPNTAMSIEADALRLEARDETRIPHMPIDHFMRSLAEQHGERSIGIILSGSGTDGTMGMREIQAHGGVTFAQDETTAKYDGMPRSAIAAGCVDYIHPPKVIAQELARIAKHPYATRRNLPADLPDTGLNTIFQLLHTATSVDFTHYRQSTVLRRIQRRMVVHKIDEIKDYVKYVQENQSELKALYRDLLINVTHFFRDPRAFEALKTIVFPRVFEKRSVKVPIRIWNPGCASGEETFSLAIALFEFLGDKVSRVPVQFFGTDVSETSVIKARASTYPENIQADVSPARLRQFFTKIEGGYRINKTLRDVCIFAQHNVLNDPPFSQMDLICCRNLLIYLEPALQHKVISLFHYALRPPGYLILGNAEGIGTANNLFSLEDRPGKIFLKRATSTRAAVTFSLPHLHQPGEAEDGRNRERVEPGWDLAEGQKEFDHRLLDQYIPAAVLINENLEVLHVRGNVGRYLKLGPGRASLNILKMAREGLQFDLQSTINRAKSSLTTVHKHDVQVGEGAAAGNDERHLTHAVNFDVVPFHLANKKPLYFMIVFSEAPAEAVKSQDRPRSVHGKLQVRKEVKRVHKLEEELAATREYLNSVIEEQEATNEELQSANEEILSSNEELQSTNEELETAKEELQSTNEELTTVNDELRSRNQEISKINSDLTNLLSSIDIPVVMLGSDLTVRRFTPVAQKLLGLIPGDVGRPFLNINPSVELPGLAELVAKVMIDFQTIEMKVKDRAGKPYSLRILPYRTLDNKVDGAVITLMAQAMRAAGNAPASEG